jgi:hypothetical protein
VLEVPTSAITPALLGRDFFFNSSLSLSSTYAHSITLYLSLMHARIPAGRYFQSLRPLKYSLSGAPVGTGLYIDKAGVIRGVPTQKDLLAALNTPMQLKVTADDSHFGVSDLVIRVNVYDPQPVYLNPPNTNQIPRQKWVYH